MHIVGPVLNILPLVGNMIITYPLPSIYRNSTVFELTAGATKIPVVHYESYDYAHFSMGKKPTEITIKIPSDKTVESIRISPRKLKIVPKRSKNEVKFILPKDQYLIVRINDYNELVIAADPLEENKPNSSGDLIYNVKSEKYKADDQGKTLTTEAFQKAIDDASKGIEEARKKDPKKGPSQATVYVPKGTYVVGNLVLKSHTALYLEGGAVLRFSGKHEHYKNHWFKKSQDRNVTWWIRTDFNSENIKVYGRGTLDGNGHLAETKGKIINNILAPLGTKNFTAEGIIIKESASWAVIPTRSFDLTFKQLKIFNRLDMPENDGIDILECQRVLVSHVIGITRDDPFTTKAYTKIFDNFHDSLPPPTNMESVTFDNLMSWTRSFGMKIGEGIFMHQNNITFQDSVVYDAAIGMGIDHKWGTGTVTNVTFQNIEVEKLSQTLDKRNTWLSISIEDPEDPNKDGGGPIDRVKIKNIRVWDQGSKNGILHGLSDKCPIGRLYFEKIMMPRRKSPGRTLKELDIGKPKFVNDIRIKEEEFAL